MKKTNNISLGGYAFVIEEDAYLVLENYLSNVRRNSSADVRDELVADIEERLAELFIEKCGRGVVVDVNTVNEATRRIGMPEDSQSKDHGTETSGSSSAQPGQNEQPKTDFLKKQLFRDPENRLIGGVMAGLSKWSGIDLVVLRLVSAIIFIATFFGSSWHVHNFGFGMLVAYVLLWVIVPAPKTVEEKCKAQGKPINYDDFKVKAETFKDTVVETAKEAGTAPLLKTFGRLFAAFFGLIFVIVGMAISISSIVAVISIPQTFLDLPWVHFCDEQIVVACLANPIIRWTGFASLLILGISFLYTGVLAIFNLKSPKWHPGLLLFLAWIGVTIACAVFVMKECAVYLPWTMTACLL